MMHDPIGRLRDTRSREQGYSPADVNAICRNGAPRQTLQKTREVVAFMAGRVTELRRRYEAGEEIQPDGEMFDFSQFCPAYISDE